MAEEYIREELDKIKTSQLLTEIGCSAGPQKKSNIFKWNILLKGPKKTCYEKGLFKLLLEFPENYPDEPPDIKFETKIFHPNISMTDGAICLSSKSNEWEQHKNLITVIYSIFDLLNKPNSEHGLNNDALILYKNNKEDFFKKAREFTEKNAYRVMND